MNIFDERPEHELTGQAAATAISQAFEGPYHHGCGERVTREVQGNERVWFTCPLHGDIAFTEVRWRL